MRDLFSGVTEQRKAGKHRLDDARVLYNCGRWRGSMYLAGYSIECLLKSKLMRKFNCRHLEELEEELQRRGVLSVSSTVFTHHLEFLLRLTDSRDRLRRNQIHWKEFNLVNLWWPAWRYSPDPSSQEDAKDFLEAVEMVSLWIENNV